MTVKRLGPIFQNFGALLWQELSDLGVMGHF